MIFFCEDCKHIDECKPRKNNPQALGCCDFGLFDDENLIGPWGVRDDKGNIRTKTEDE